MRVLINSKLLMKPTAQPSQKPFEICDTRLSGFVLRVQPTGMRSFYARFGRSRRFALGKADVIDAEVTSSRSTTSIANLCVCNVD
jgi:hypothetical protein